ncbi:MAG: MBL fold metallo-hydrolase [Clostridia bacterium]|nr:MBL fold metallo-hydrolase [Clostridia bacterium]
MKVISLGSGSKGNATLIEMDGKYILIDQGFSLKELSRRCDISFKDFSAILLTHEHSDHFLGVGALSKDYSIPVYMPKALDAVCSDRLLDCDVRYHNDVEFEVEGIKVSPFRLPHDARYTVGYKLQKGEQSFACVTDLGEARENLFDNLVGVDTVLLESNYDEEMLKSGPYPEALKRRVSGRLGHLSNQESAKVSARLISKGTKNVILAHLSENNNVPELAYDTTAKYLEKNLNCDVRIRLLVAEQDKVKIF